MSYYQLVMKRNLGLILNIISILISAFSLIIVNKALNITKEPYLIAIDTNGTRVVSRQDDPIFDTEAISFCRDFVKQMYNFTPSTFHTQIGDATKLLSVKLWKEKESGINQYQARVILEQISLDAQITKILKNSANNFTVLVGTIESNRFAKTERNLKLDLNFSRVQRTPSNPYGLEVISYVENQIK